MLDHELRVQKTQLTRADKVAAHGVPALLVAVGTYMTTSDGARQAFGAGHLGPSTALFRRVAGLRTAWLGVAVLALHRADQHRALGWLLLTMAMNPAADMALAVKSGGGRRALVHLPGILATSIFGARLLRLTQPPNRPNLGHERADLS